MIDIVADEHVPGAVVNALLSNGYDVHYAHTKYRPGADDAELLRNCNEDGCVLLTNDRDFVELAHEEDHSGVIIYTNQELSPREVIRAVIRIDDMYVDGLENRIEWLEGWI